MAAKTLLGSVQGLSRTTPGSPEALRAPLRVSIWATSQREPTIVSFYSYFLSLSSMFNSDYSFTISPIFPTYFDHSINRMHLRECPWGSSGKLSRPPMTPEQPPRHPKDPRKSYALTVVLSILPWRCESYHAPGQKWNKGTTPHPTQRPSGKRGDCVLSSIDLM